MIFASSYYHAIIAVLPALKQVFLQRAASCSLPIYSVANYDIQLPTMKCSELPLSSTSHNLHCSSMSVVKIKAPTF